MEDTEARRLCYHSGWSGELQPRGGLKAARQAHELLDGPRLRPVRRELRNGPMRDWLRRGAGQLLRLEAAVPDEELAGAVQSGKQTKPRMRQHRLDVRLHLVPAQDTLLHPLAGPPVDVDAAQPDIPAIGRTDVLHERHR